MYTLHPSVVHVGSKSSGIKSVIGYVYTMHTSVVHVYTLYTSVVHVYTMHTSVVHVGSKSTFLIGPFEFREFISSPTNYPFSGIGLGEGKSTY